MTDRYILGVDSGGTFTDFVLLDPQGRIRIDKRPSTPEDPAQSVGDGVAELRAHNEFEPGFTLVHGTTVATNALLERRIAPTALLTTAGFRDLLAIGRQARDTLYTLSPSKPECLLPRQRRLEAVERIDWLGDVLTPLVEASVQEALDRIVQEGVESLAVCLLFSYLNPAHEKRIGELARARGLSVSLSCEIAPEPREYERTATTVANACVLPIMAGYLSRLGERVVACGGSALRVMQSNGGAMSQDEAAGQAIRTALSGPAAGVIAAGRVGIEAGYPDLISFDMGGTSTDTSLLVGGRCALSTSGEVAGMPLLTPMLDIHTVGAGGGSLIRIDGAGGLRVGPQSAGANPGPVAYGKGETLTVTDAHLQLGRLPGSVRLAGRLPLDVDRVHRHFQTLAQRLDCEPERAALGVIQVANAAMTRALRHISVERGHDPSRFTLLSYGGAGGLHACELAESLHIHTVLIPRYPGAFSALGLVAADVRREYVRALPAHRTLDPKLTDLWDALQAGYEELTLQAEQDMANEGFPAGAWQAERSLDLRYVGQSFALRIPVGSHLEPVRISADFHDAHRSRYGHSDPREPIETTALRLTAIGREAQPAMHFEEQAVTEPSTITAPVYEPDGWSEARIYSRTELKSGQSIAGPSIVIQDDATTYLPSHWQGKVDPQSNLIVTRV